MDVRTGLQRPAKKGSPCLVALFMVGVGLMLLGVAVIFLVPRSLGFDGETTPPIHLENFSVPEISLVDLQGNATSLSDYRGQVVLLNNWATWCPPCQAEMPELQQYYTAHQDEGFVVVAIESGEPAELVTDFARQMGLTFPIWLDPQQEVVQMFSNYSLPSSYVVDKTGEVRMYWTGAIDQKTLEKYVTPLLEE